LLALLLPLSACTTWTHVKPKPQKLSGGLSVTPESEWSSIKTGATHTWTVHGPDLEAITVVSGLKDGKPLLPPVARKEKMPLFRSSMAAPEIAQLVVETLLRRGYGDVELGAVKPETFAGRAGFRFELDLTAANGLEKSGFGVGAIVDSKLYMLVYRAPKLYYFEAYRPAVESLISSAGVAD
jgi:hypothetical protein